MLQTQAHSSMPKQDQPNDQVKHLEYQARALETEPVRPSPHASPPWISSASKRRAVSGFLFLIVINDMKPIVLVVRFNKKIDLKVTRFGSYITAP